MTNSVIYNISMKKWTSKQIRNLRDRHKVSQKALGDLLGVSKQHIYYLERGARVPSKTLQILLSFIEEKLKEKGE